MTEENISPSNGRRFHRFHEMELNMQSKCQIQNFETAQAGSVVWPSIRPTDEKHVSTRIRLHYRLKREYPVSHSFPVHKQKEGEENTTGTGEYAERHTIGILASNLSVPFLSSVVSLFFLLFPPLAG